MKKEEALDWLRENDPDADYLSHYIPKCAVVHTLAKNTPITETLFEHISNNKGYAALIEKINAESSTEETKIERAAIALKKLLMLAIFFDSLVDKNKDIVYLKTNPEIKLNKYYLCVERLLDQKNKGAAIVISCRDDTEKHTDRWYSVAFSIDIPTLLNPKLSYSQVTLDIELFASHYEISPRRLIPNMNIHRLSFDALNLTK